MNIENIFKQLGLKSEHAKIYLANLEWGETSITNLARKSKLPRTSIYIFLKELLELGLVTQTLKQGKKFYTPADPEFLITLLQQRELEVKSSISEIKTKMKDLKTIQNTNPKKPKLLYLEGPEGIMQAYEKTFEAKEILIQCFTEDYKNVVSDEFFSDYFDRFFSSNIRSKEILTVADQDYINRRGSEKNLQLMVPTDRKIETDLMIYDNTVIFVSFNKDNPYALVVEDDDISNCMRSIYDNAWKWASQNDPRIKQGENIKTEF